MVQVRCTCGAVVVEIPGTVPTGFLTPCPDCDPDGYARRFSCPWPHHAPDTDIAFLRRRVAVLENKLITAIPADDLARMRDRVIRSALDHKLAWYEAHEEPSREADIEMIESREDLFAALDALQQIGGLPDDMIDSILAGG